MVVMKNIFKEMTIERFSTIGINIVAAILLLQTTRGLFVASPPELEQMDIIFRTTLSTIYAYLLSTTFASKKAKTSDNAVILKAETEGNERKSSSKKLLEARLITVIAISVYCLVIMIVVRNFSDFIVQSSSTASTISLYRDFSVGGIGAMLGYIKMNND